MKRRISLLLAAIIVTAASGYAVTQLLIVPASVERDGLPVGIINRWNHPGICDLFWAGGLAVNGDEGFRIYRLDAGGRITAVLDTKWVIELPSSHHCRDYVVMGLFRLKSSDFKNPDAKFGFPGLIDLNTGEHTKLASGDKLSLFLNVYAYSCQFWSPDQMVLLGRKPHDSHERTLVLLRRPSAQVTEWTPPNGGHPASWVWSASGKRPGFWVLTDHPGALYQLGGTKEEELRIPALDGRVAVMLSPRLDRAIAFPFAATAFYGFSADAYLVDFSKPDQKKPIDISGFACKDSRLGWGAWSPDGKQVALLLLDDRGNEAKPYELYVGDPATSLRKISCEGLRFPGSDWLEKGEDAALPGPGSIVWHANSRLLYCRMIDEKSSHRDRVQYVIVAVDTAK